MTCDDCIVIMLQYYISYYSFTVRYRKMNIKVCIIVQVVSTLSNEMIQMTHPQNIKPIFFFFCILVVL